MSRLVLFGLLVAGLVSTTPGAELRPTSSQASTKATATTGRYRNPVMSGDYPDPSVIRVGTEYWATATTSQWAPIFPLLRSTDLVNWERVGAVFQTPPAWSSGSYWAPEIAQDGGRFFVYYTARRKDGPLCIAVADAPSPRGPYTDRGPLTCQDVGSIDAMPVRDEHGRRYVVWKEDGNSRKRPTPLWAQPLSDDGTRLVGEKREILRNEASWEAHLIEGPFILRRHGRFYMFYSSDACCGRACNYKLGVARSRSLLGPWERHPGNPILVGNRHWKCPGHGSIVDDPSGRMFLLYHAYDPQDFEYVGRQGLLDEVTWDAQGWPAINGGRGPSATAAVPRRLTQRPSVGPLADAFDGPALDPAWQWPWDQSPAPKIERGALVLQTAPVPSSGAPAARPASAVPGRTIAAAARPTSSGSYVATTAVDVGWITSGARAGLAAFGNRDNLIAVTLEPPAPVSDGPGQAIAGDALTLSVWQVRKGERRVLARDLVGRQPLVHLRLSATDRSRFAFAWSADGTTWKTLPVQAEGADLPPWDLAVRVALVLDGPPKAQARFADFAVQPGAPR